MNYYELQITIDSFDEWHDILVAYLAELDYESFVEETPILKAYIQEAHYDGHKLQALLKELHDKGVTEVLLFPLYPQHAMASTTTILVLAEELRAKHFPDMKFTTVPAFYNKPGYIEALSNSIKKHLEGFDYDHLLFSYHGIPKRHIRKTDITKSAATGADFRVNKRIEDL